VKESGGRSWGSWGRKKGIRKKETAQSSITDI